MGVWLKGTLQGVWLMGACMAAGCVVKGDMAAVGVAADMAKMRAWLYNYRRCGLEGVWVW